MRSSGRTRFVKLGGSLALVIVALCTCAPLAVAQVPVFDASGSVSVPLAATPKIRVTPKIIDFGRVRLGVPIADTFFTIENLGSADLLLTNPGFGGQVTDNTFGVSAVTSPTLRPNTLIQVAVHIAPLVEGVHQQSIAIESTDPDSGTSPKAPVVTLKATVVVPKVASAGAAFGAVRVGDISPRRMLTIYNRGSDSTRIDSVMILSNSDLADFTVALDTFPPRKPLPLHLGYEASDSSLSYAAQFTPQSLGKKRLVVAIYSPERTLYDTLMGEGVEPLVQVAPAVLNFGTDTVRKIGAPNPAPLQFDLPFEVANNGSYDAQLLRLVYHDSTHFLVRLNRPTVDLYEPLPIQESITGTVTFFVKEEGDFIDTLTITNDTRYALYGDTIPSYPSRLILKAKVRTGPIDSSFAVYRDTIKTCDTSMATLVIHNPYPVEVHIDSIRFGDTPEDTLGFSLGQFGFPINIAPDSTFPIPLLYSFPDELLNGSQTLSLILYQRQGGAQPPIERRVTASLVRQRRTLTLHANLPKWLPSAADMDPMRLPITLEGPRANVGELDSFQLALTFSNDLIEPIRIDPQNSLLAPLAPNGYIHTNWDQTSRTYTITAVGVPVSNPATLSNNLLMTIVMRAFLTTDTVVTVTPTFTFLKHPCAYNLQPFTLTIPYANECGEPVIREFMRTGSSPEIDILGVQSNPVEPGEDLVVSVSAKKAAELEIQVANSAGELASTRVQHLMAGASTLRLPAAALPSSGAALVSLIAHEPGSGRVIGLNRLKIAIRR